MQSETNIALYLSDPMDTYIVEGHKGAQYGTFADVEKKLSGIPEIQFVKGKRLLRVFHLGDCTVTFSGRRDREIPNDPLVFGSLLITGTSKAQKQVLERLNEVFPGLQDST